MWTKVNFNYIIFVNIIVRTVPGVSALSNRARQGGAVRKFTGAAVFHPLFLLIYPLNALLCLPDRI